MAEAVQKAQTPRVTVRLYRFKNRLKEKIGGLSTGPGKIPEEALAKAEAALEEMAEDYPDWVSSLIQKLSELHRRCVDTPEERRELFKDIAHIAHDMKGQGGTFGYPLISTFAESLYSFTHGQPNETDNHVEIIKAHVDSMRVVIKERISGSGGDVGDNLTKGLQQAIRKHDIR